MKKKSFYSFIPLVILLVAMFIIHKYVFLYADDLYYSRDAQNTLSFLPNFMLKQLNLNGRVWVHVLLLGLVKYDVLLFRIFNPIVITLAAYLIAKVCLLDNNKNNSSKLFPAVLISSTLFLTLPARIATTTIFYAACSLNYLYPIVVAILFGYTFYKFYLNKNNIKKISWFIIILAFFAGSSTQQAGMISLGFAVLSSLYFIIFKKYKFTLNHLSYYISLFIGYGLVTYGSIKRMLFESDSGVHIQIKNTILALLKSNIFSRPVSIFILLICISSIIWLLYFILNEDNKSTFNKILSSLTLIALVLSTLAYFYAIVIKDYDITSSGIKIKLFYLGFTSIYLFSIFYTSTLIMLYKYNPFILFCVINAVGAQIMLLVADSRFADSYKIIFPSLILMFIFISYTFTQLFNNNLFKFNKLLFILIVIPLIFVSTKFFLQNFNGYKITSKEIAYNLNVIKNYQNSADKDTLELKKVPPSMYGYNLGNWNNMPYFMKQCYKINENTIINYIE
ncbi:DUF6056 family protein [Clostridium sp. NSJ-145]|uniref:DUF6056 family protein n=1 Tax=Clostridium sp. NSJ-145 TaxID=2897777 RepID=UPI001E4E1F7C|nr:DUF6056 family protein [Clostridium sp. NSJ-145]MCD2502371.1 DUF6056 family protein [Clostridium sp. NSJ-145]